MTHPVASILALVSVMRNETAQLNQALLSPTRASGALSHLNEATHLMRGGDALIQASKGLPKHPKLTQATSTLVDAMQASAVRALIYDGEAKNPSEALAKLNASFADPLQVHSDSIIRSIFDTKPRFEHSWAAVEYTAKLLFDHQHYRVAGAFFERLSGIHDDNDMAVCISQSRTDLMEQCFLQYGGQSATLWQDAFELVKLDNAAMQPNFDASSLHFDDYVAYEQKHWARISTEMTEGRSPRLG